MYPWMNENEYNERIYMKLKLKLRTTIRVFWVILQVFASRSFHLLSFPNDNINAIVLHIDNNYSKTQLIISKDSRNHKSWHRYPVLGPNIYSLSCIILSYKNWWSQPGILDRTFGPNCINWKLYNFENFIIIL